jgi:heme exporter protein A
MLSATQLACSRGERLLFKDLSLSLAPGAWLQVSGTNGAGKTTLLRTLVGLCEPERGEVCWSGVPIVQCAETFRRALLFLGHHAAVKDELTPLENLRLGNELDGLPLAETDALVALQRMGLQGRGNLPTRWLSAGQKRRVLLARLLVRPATLWVLDEPFAALDAAAVALVGELIASHLARGGAAVLTSHQPVPLAGGSEVVL